jgi:hypothetical protein|eukprot:COSAG06_NODE_2542_length_6702_cov_6.759049_2_plen_128_part_00
MAGWSNLTQLQLRTLLRSHGQPTDGGKAALVQRLAAFLSDDNKADVDGDRDDDVGEGGPSASETAELEAAGASTELSAWRVAMSQLDDLTASLAQLRAQARAEARAAHLAAEGQAKAGRHVHSSGPQ